MIIYRVNIDSFKEVQDALGLMKDKSKYIMRGAINETAKDVREILIDYVYENYDVHLSRSKFKKRYTDIKKAKVSKLIATVIAQSPVTDMYDYTISPRKLYRGWSPVGKPKYVKGHIKSSVINKKLALRLNLAGTGEDQYKAFVVRYKSGHITLAQRVPGKRMKSDPTKEFVKTLFSPSVAKLMGGEEGAYNRLQPEINDILTKHIKAQTEKFLVKGVKENSLS